MQKALKVQPPISTSKIGVDKWTPYAMSDLKLYFCDDLRNAQESRAAPWDLTSPLTKTKWTAKQGKKKKAKETQPEEAKA